jgi:hypothetical protein
MKQWIYNKSASVKNKNLLCREIGSKLRKVMMFREVRERKASMTDLITSNLRLSREKGYRVYNESDMSFKWTAEVVGQSRDLLSHACKEDLSKKSGGEMYTGLLPVKDITSNSVYVKFALQKNIINKVSEYLGAVPVLAHVGVWYSPKTSKGDVGSKLFHLDQADVRQVKVFVYCSDVSEDDGPLTLIDASESEKIAREIRYNYSDSGQCLQDDIIKRYVEEDHWIKLTGAQGTVITIDSSSCFHLGSRTTEHSSDRLVAVFQYLLPTAFTLPWAYRSKLPCAHLDWPEATALDKMVLGIR